MAGPATTRLQVLVDTPGVEKLPKLASSLKRLTVSTKEAGLSFTKLSAGLKQQAIDGGKSINNTRSLANAWKELAANVKFGSKEFIEATAQAKQLNAELAKMEGRKGGGMGRMARTAGAVAGAGVFGGPEGAIGAAIGGLMPGGGPVSAAVGGAIGAQVGMVRKSIGEMTEYSASLALQRKALKLVIADTNKYTKAQEFLSRKSEKLAIPQDVIVRQFTALTASVKGAGHSVEDAEKVFESIASGIRGTGGSLEDMKAAMTATAQVFSKGKVSAEELRQQLGERLPGAFTIFAESMGKTPAELDKALEQGKVTLDDFMTFSKTLFAKYGKNAELLAAGPEAAGDRLAVSLTNLRDNLGELLTPIGADFQDTFKIIVDIIDDAVTGLKDFLKIGEKFHQENLNRLKAEKTMALEQLQLLNEKKTADEEFINNIKAKVEEGKKLTTQETVQYNLTESRLIGTKVSLRDLAVVLKELDVDIAVIQEKMKDLASKSEDAATKSVSLWANMKIGADSYFKSIEDVGKQTQDLVVNAFKKMEDSLVNFVTTGKFKFKDFARSIIADLTKMFIRAQMLSMFKGLKNLFTPGADTVDTVLGSTGMAGALDIEAGRNRNALGNIYGKNGIVPFAKGGIVNRPTIFPFSKGIGLMGEAGEEAIIPLRRGKDGRLGVESSGAGVGNIVVNVDASGSSVEGDAGQSEELGLILGAAVQAEIVNQQRPGGLLAGTR